MTEETVIDVEDVKTEDTKEIVKAEAHTALVPINPKITRPEDF